VKETGRSFFQGTGTVLAHAEAEENREKATSK
jgi:hypothetical protein